MILGGITKAAILYFMIHGVALLATKALIIAKAALIIGTALALKKSLGKILYPIGFTLYNN
jgi:hypothetical protein